MTKEEIQVELGNRIVHLRKTKGIKQIDLANKLGIEDSALRRIERGKANCTLWLLYRISEAFEISLSDLVSFPEHKS